VGYIGAGIFGGAQLAAQAAAAQAPIRLQPTVITVTPPAGDPAAAAAAAAQRVSEAPHNYVVAGPALASGNTMVYAVGAALLAGAFLLTRK
jgi:hypothetical protein